MIKSYNNYWNVIPSSFDRHFTMVVFNPRIGDFITYDSKQYKINDIDYNTRNIYVGAGRYALQGNNIEIR